MKKKKENKNKEEILIPNFTLLLTLIFFLLGAFPMFSYWNRVKKCTVEIRGVVVDERISSKKIPDTSDPKNRYLWGRAYSDIKVDTDGIFKYDHLYAGAGVGKTGDTIIIRYDPDDPDEYYFVGYYSNGRTFATFTWGVSGSMIILSLFFFVYYNMPLLFPKKKEDN